MRGVFDALPVTAVIRDAQAPPMPTGTWPGAIPAVTQLLADGLTLGPLTVLVGENGSGKSTITEAIAQAYGLSPEGGSTGARNTTRSSESELHARILLRRGIGASRWGYFLRAETMHGLYTYLEDRGVAGLHEMSHGESFIEVLTSRFNDPGFYVLDEPESALSFTGCLALVRLLHDMATDGRRQAIVATHSPIIAATPGATILEVGEWGLRPTTWEDLELVQNWRDFLEDPSIHFRYLLDEG